MWPKELLNRKLLLVTGKGGVGKTTLVVSLAQMFQNEGKNVVVVESSKIPQLPEFSKGLGLQCENLDIAQCFKDYVIEKLHQPKLYETVFSRDSVKTFLETIPGLSEVMLLGWMYYAVNPINPKKNDVVIFDAPSSGHFLTLLTTPKAIVDSALGGPLVNEIEKIQEFLTNGSSSIVYLASPEELVVSEALDFLPKIQKKTDVPIDMIIVNRVPEPNHRIEAPTKVKDWLSNEFLRNFSAIDHLSKDMPIHFFKKSYTLSLTSGLRPPLIPESMNALLASLKPLVKNEKNA